MTHPLPRSGIHLALPLPADRPRAPRARKAVVAALALAALAAPAPALAEPPPATAKTRATVTLVTLGRFPRALADAVAAALAAELQVEVRRIDDLPLPREAYYPPRKRYRADKILTHIRTLVPEGARILALTDVDISTTKGRYPDWGVFGLGEIGGRACVISIFRLSRNARGPEHLRFRVTGTAIHEVGHTLGLPHCTEPRCVMLDAEGSIATVDSTTGHLGPGCRTLVDQTAPLRAASP